MENEMQHLFTLPGLVKGAFAAGTAWAGVFLGQRQMRKDLASLKKFRHEAEQVISSLVTMHESNHQQKVKASFKGAENGD